MPLEGGKIVERGTPTASLYALAGRYRDLYDKQHGLEANLFLATGEGEIPEPTEANGLLPKNSDPDMLRLLRDRPA